MLCRGVDISFRNTSQNRPVVLGKCRPEVQGYVSTRKERIDRFFRQEGLIRRYEATAVLIVLSRVDWLG